MAWYVVLNARGSDNWMAFFSTLSPLSTIKIKARGNQSLYGAISSIHLEHNDTFWVLWLAFTIPY
jgi:hypothetical protein